MASNYDNTAWFYDSLAKLVFGENIKKSQTEFLHHIPAKSTILVAGGGTGWILEEIAKVHASGLTIFYVEVSQKMIALARKRKCGENTVIFINQPVEEFSADGINVAVTPFLFDNHEPEAALQIFKSIDQKLVASGLWLNTDFQLTGKWWQVVLLKTMLLFFKLFRAVDNNGTTNMGLAFENNRYKKIAAKTFYSDFIRTDVWQKTR